MTTHSTHVETTLHRLATLDAQFARGSITRRNVDEQRLIALFDLVHDTIRWVKIVEDAKNAGRVWIDG
ncbi:hypothetical protein UFOVP658_51 [uncultured Caudovirales phage]|uniref:Uncharacterized protein n=1 Tax=uncultured Caudovirales phage TaxID=2100421 RepID=A0A6J5NBK2_9CAUD|nr:hypothetical protein UFOVP658_51 [uncultured Caudovirales phage]